MLSFLTAMRNGLSSPLPYFPLYTGKYSHSLLPRLFFFVIALPVTEGDLLFLFPAERFGISVLVCGGSVSYGISSLITLQRAAKPDQITRKTTMPTMVPSKIRASHTSTDSAVLRLGGET